VARRTNDGLSRSPAAPRRRWRRQADPAQKWIARRDEAARVGLDFRQRGWRLVFTNGCFDLLHAGHVRYLEAARRLGDGLMVGLNTDDSVRRLKGPTRPVTPLAERAYVLGGLGCVDFVVSFEEDTPARLIEAVGPLVLCKGGDWPEEKIVGRDTVRALGGEVYSLELVEGLSTTRLIEKIVALNKAGRKTE
jgi:rfaE bifunctional protein nucleotidyltransferase chain/domain